MTDTAGPFDGAPWAEGQWARHAAVWAPSGAYGAAAASSTSGDLPLSVSGRSVGLGAGRAWVRGFGFERTGAAVMQDPGANTHGSFSRRDRIVLRRDLATHTITQVVIQGTPASSPAAPALTRSETGSWDLPMFSFLVPPNSAASITGIVDERGWLIGGGPLAFATTTARDAHFPAPVKGDVCVVDGIDHVYNGSRWVFSKGGSINTGTDTDGVVTVIHDLGVVPSDFQVTKGSYPAAAISDARVNALSTTQAQLVFTRTDTAATLGGNPVTAYWKGTS